MHLRVGSSRGQLKIQQMAFVLVALMVLFGIVLIFYVSIKTASLRTGAEDIRELQSQELARKITGSPEFVYPSGTCTACVDMDKAFVLKERVLQNPDYAAFWNVPLIQVKRLSGEERECTRQNYPNCTTITIYSSNSSFTSVSSFITACSHDEQRGGQGCDLGKIVLGVRRA